jgi:hypothetical protein
MRTLALVALVLAVLAAGSTAAGRTAPQCSDGRDNDGDGLVDWRVDPGCTDARDDSEGTRLRCRLGHVRLGRSYLIQGECSGPFATMTVDPPRGARLDGDPKPEVENAHRCRSVNGRLVCAMEDGAANRRHAVRAGFAFVGSPTGPARVRFGDERGNAVAWGATERLAGARDTSADLRVDVVGPVRHVHDPREGNQRIDYRIRVRNAGPGESPGGVVVYDVRGAKPGLWDVYPGGWVQRPCKIKLKQCMLGKMPAGATAEILVSVPAPPGRVRTGSGADDVSVTAEAAVAGEAPDPVKLSNSDTSTTPVEPPAAVVELHAAAEPERAFIDKLTGVAIVRLSALVRNLGPLNLRQGETSLDFRSFGRPGITLVRTFGVPCEQGRADPQFFGVACELGAIGAGAGFTVSITVSFSTPGRYSIEALASARIANSIFNERMDREFATVEVLAPPP